MTLLHIIDGEWYPSVGECLVMLADADYDWWFDNAAEHEKNMRQRAHDINNLPAYMDTTIIAYVN
jgi:hypothetical protein